jgi:hypothetical protein
MSSRQETVLLPGVLIGHGYEAECTVRATKVELLGPAGMAMAVAFSRYSICNVSKKIPDGSYKLSVNAEIIPMRLHEGLWFADGLI